MVVVTMFVGGTVISAEPTEGGKKLRVMVAGSGRVNDLVLFPATARITAGDELAPTPVDVTIERGPDQRPTGLVVCWAHGTAPLGGDAA